MEINKMDWGFLQPLKELWPQQLPEFLDKIDWQALFHNPYFIGLAVIVLAYALYKRMYKFLALVFCSGAFFYASRYVATGGEDTVSLKNIISFIGLSIVIIAVAVYFFFIRSE